MVKFNRVWPFLFYVILFYFLSQIFYYIVIKLYICNKNKYIVNDGRINIVVGICFVYREIYKLKRIHFMFFLPL